MLLIGIWLIGSISSSTTSARLPTSNEPIWTSRWRARAPRIVAISKASWALTTLGSAVMSLCSLAAVSISSQRLRSLLEAEPSVPSPPAGGLQHLPPIHRHDLPCGDRYRPIGNPSPLPIHGHHQSTADEEVDVKQRHT